MRVLYVKTKRGNVVEHIADEKKYDAQDVTLSIDEKLQSMVYREIKKAVTENKAEIWYCGIGRCAYG